MNNHPRSFHAEADPTIRDLVYIEERGTDNGKPGNRIEVVAEDLIPLANRLIELHVNHVTTRKTTKENTSNER